MEDVEPDNEKSGGPPYDMGLTMSAPMKKKINKKIRPQNFNKGYVRETVALDFRNFETLLFKESTK